MFAIFFIVGVICVGFAIWAYGEDRSAAQGCCVSTAILFFVLTIAGLIAYVDSIDNYGELEGIRDSIVSYERISREVNNAYYTIDKSQILELEKSPPIISLNLENMKQSTNVSQSLIGIRDTIRDYNVLLGRYRSSNKNWFTRMFIAKLPDGLKPIVVNENILEK